MPCTVQFPFSFKLSLSTIVLQYSAEPFRTVHRSFFARSCTLTAFLGQFKRSHRCSTSFGHFLYSCSMSCSRMFMLFFDGSFLVKRSFSLVKIAILLSISSQFRIFHALSLLSCDLRAAPVYQVSSIGLSLRIGPCFMHALQG
jgi:hypothetical protein